MGFIHSAITQLFETKFSPITNLKGFKEFIQGLQDQKTVLKNHNILSSSMSPPANMHASPLDRYEMSCITSSNEEKNILMPMPWGWGRLISLHAVGIYGIIETPDGMVVMVILLNSNGAFTRKISQKPTGLDTSLFASIYSFQVEW